MLRMAFFNGPLGSNGRFSRGVRFPPARRGVKLDEWHKRLAATGGAPSLPSDRAGRQAEPNANTCVKVPRALP